MALWHRLITALAFAGAVMFVAAGAMLTWEVLARYFFVRPTIWAAELSQACLIWGTLIAAPWCLRERRHIRITAVIQRLGPAAYAWAEAGVMAMVAVFSAVVAWQGSLIFFDSFERGRTTGSMLDLPVWIVELAVPLGCALLAVQAALELGAALRGERPAEERHE